MCFNAKKCYTMRISRSPKPLTKFYTLMGHTLEEVPNSTYFGVTISDIKWDAHINMVYKKSNQLLGFLWRNLKYSPQSLKNTAYKITCPMQSGILLIYLGPILY